MNTLLFRQIGRLLKDPVMDDSQMKAFLEVVSKTYDELEENKDFLAHTLEIVSTELTEANEMLRRESESRVRHLSDYFEETLAQQSNIIFRCKTEGGGFAVGLARGRLLNRLGLKPADLENEGISPLIRNPVDLESFEFAWQGKDQRFEVAFEHAQMVCEVFLHPLVEDGHVVEIIGIVSDVTKQKAAEELLRQTSSDLEQRSKEQEKSAQVMLSMIEDLDQSRANIARERDRSNALAAEAAAANRAKSEFLATMSHEIRTPMNGVMGFAQLLQLSELSEQQQEFVSAISSSAESLLRVINDVLDFSKIESGHMGIETSPFCLQTCIEEAIETVSTTAAEKRLDLAAHVTAEVPSSIVGDSLRLRQVLVNLLGNAVKFTPSGEVKLEVSATPAEPGQVLLSFSVTDTGIGISSDQIDQLFKAFHQEDSSTSRRFGGSGLGLAICRRLVELMGGSISVKSRPAEGSVFSFQISVPVADEQIEIVAPIPFPDLIGKRALVVDGHAFSRKVIVDLLDRWGMDVRSAPSPDYTNALLHDWEPQVLLLDSGCTGPTDVAFATSLTRQGTRLFLLCQPGDALTLRERLGDAISGTLFKPLKVSPLFNSLIAETHGINTRIIPSSHSFKPQQPNDRPLQLLLAEDNVINRKLALAVLAQMGCTADIAVDGHAALNATMVTRYDVILMDVQMPGMDGLEATRQIRKWEKKSGTPPVRIIALTANALAGDRDICIKAGMDDYLSKPIRFEALRAALQNTGDTRSSSDETTATPQNPALIALRQLAGELSPDDAVSLASDFLTDLDGQVAAVRNAIDLRNSGEARRHAHSLRGTASIFCLTDLQGAAESIENACSDGRLDDAEAAWPVLQEAAQEAVYQLQPAITAVATAAILEPMS